MVIGGRPGRQGPGRRGVAGAGRACYLPDMPPPYERHVFICTNKRPEGAPKPSCGHRGGEAVRDAFKKQLAALGLHKVVRANQSGCLDACEQGPSVVIYPDDVWYGGVRPEDVEEIIRE